MADYGSQQSPKINFRESLSSFFSSPRLFTGFLSKGSGEAESFMSSPTSILDTESCSALRSSFSSDMTTPKIPRPESKSLWEKLDSRGVGLGIVDALIEEKSSSNLSKMVLFGSQLKIQVPPVPSPDESPNSAGDFGIKTRNSFVGSFSPCLSPSPVKKSPFGSSNSGVFSCVSASEMELSEEYTCVISYGPNPRTTHIFDDCVVESCCGIAKFSESRKENGFFSDRSMSYPSESFLSFCYSCKKDLGQGEDIYMYRGEKAFCSNECRYEEMMLDEDGLETSDTHGAYRS